MLVVVAGTSPVLIGEIDVLWQLYLRVMAEHHPAWIEVRKAQEPDAALADLDAGEASAIALAALETDVLLLIDESAGRLEASRRGIPNTGTLGVLRRAAIENLVDMRSVLDRLLATNFRASKALVDDLLAEDADRKRPAAERSDKQ